MARTTIWQRERWRERDGEGSVRIRPPLIYFAILSPIMWPTLSRNRKENRLSENVQWNLKKLHYQIIWIQTLIVSHGCPSVIANAPPTPPAKKFRIPEILLDCGVLLPHSMGISFSLTELCILGFDLFMLLSMCIHSGYIHSICHTRIVRDRERAHAVTNYTITQNLC